MPRGKHYVETGLLQREGSDLVLQRDAGGRWRLDVGRDADALIGLRVCVQGARADFDLLDVTAITKAV